MKNVKPSYAEGLIFDPGLLEPDQLNFIDHGPASMLDINLAINELDPVMGSNLNFRSADAFKMMITRSGLEEVRLILHYQIMHKHALIAATRCNQTILDHSEKALAEIKMVKRNMALPNMALSLSSVFSRTSDGIDPGSLSKATGILTTNLQNNVALCIQSVSEWKGH